MTNDSAKQAKRILEDFRKAGGADLTGYEEIFADMAAKMPPRSTSRGLYDLKGGEVKYFDGKGWSSIGMAYEWVRNLVQPMDEHIRFETGQVTRHPRGMAQVTVELSVRLIDSDQQRNIRRFGARRSQSLDIVARVNAGEIYKMNGLLTESEYQHSVDTIPTCRLCFFVNSEETIPS